MKGTTMLRKTARFADNAMFIYAATMAIVGLIQMATAAFFAIKNR